MSDKTKRVCLPIPPILLPVKPLDPKIGAPAWMTPPPRICRLKRGDCISLDDVKWRDRYGGYRLTPRGFPNDGMSYGWLVRMLTGWDNYDENTIRSAITHDCPYSMHDHLCNWSLPRKKVDIDLLDGLRNDRDPSFAWIKYRAVRRIGWIPWGIVTEDELVKQWILCLWEGDKILDEWIAKVIKEQGI